MKRRAALAKPSQEGPNRKRVLFIDRTVFLLAIWPAEMHEIVLCPDGLDSTIYFGDF